MLVQFVVLKQPVALGMVRVAEQHDRGLVTVPAAQLSIDQFKALDHRDSPDLALTLQLQASDDSSSTRPYKSSCK